MSVQRWSFNPLESKEEISHFVRNDTVGWFFCPFLGLVGKECPLPIICHPEPHLRGVSYVNGGGIIHHLKFWIFFTKLRITRL